MCADEILDYGLAAGRSAEVATSRGRPVVKELALSCVSASIMCLSAVHPPSHPTLYHGILGSDLVAANPSVSGLTVEAQFDDACVNRAITPYQ